MDRDTDRKLLAIATALRCLLAQGRSDAVIRWPLAVAALEDAFPEVKNL